MKLIDHEEKVVNLTNSSRSTFDVCRRKFYYSNIAGEYGIRPVGYTSFALLFGDVAHAMFAAALRESCTLSSIQKAGVAVLVKAEESVEVPSAKLITNIAKARATAESFGHVALEIAERICSEFKVEGVEEIRAMNIGSVTNGLEEYTVMLHGKLDVLGTTAVGLPVIIDHKTVSAYKSAFYDRCLFDHQLTTYALLTSKGHERTQVIFNCVRKPGLRQGKSESDSQYAKRLCKYIEDTDPDEYIKWVRTERTEDDMARMQATYLQVAEDLLQADRHQEWRQNMAVCDLYSGCEYLPICTGADPECINFTTRQQAHEELQEEDEW